MKHGHSKTDHFPDVHLETLSRYLSVSGDPVDGVGRQTGAGHPLDEQASSMEDSDEDSNSTASSVTSESSEPQEFGDVQAQITQDLQANINHRPVKVPRARNPFKSEHIYQLFRRTFDALHKINFIPPHMGLTRDTWPDGIYPDHVDLTFGRRLKQLTVHLPLEIWFARAILWGQALHVMNFVIFQLEE
jgi:hypothetical protein